MNLSMFSYQISINSTNSVERLWNIQTYFLLSYSKESFFPNITYFCAANLLVFCRENIFILDQNLRKFYELFIRLKRAMALDGF